MTKKYIKDFAADMVQINNVITSVLINHIKYFENNKQL